MEQHILDFIRNVYQSIGWPGVVLLMAIESACVPLPSEIIMPLAGWMLIRERARVGMDIISRGFTVLSAMSSARRLLTGWEHGAAVPSCGVSANTS